MYVINTLGILIDQGYSISAHCNADGCHRVSRLDLVALADKLGRDFVVIGDPNPLVPRLRCSRCSSRDISLIIQPDTRPLAPTPPNGLCEGVGVREDLQAGRRRAPSSQTDCSRLPSNHTSKRSAGR